MVKFLCIESAAEYCSVSVFENEACLCTVNATEKHAHSTSLAVMIQQCLVEAQIDVRELQAIGISSGPGSYTGLRVGASIAKGMCYALNLPLIAMDSLAILAQPFLIKKEQKIIIPTIDARRDEAYIRIYRSDGHLDVDSTPHIFTSSSFLEFNSEVDILICGNAATKAEVILAHLNQAFFVQTYPSSVDMGSTVFSKYQAEDIADTAYFEPNYIKSPNITRQKKPLIS